MRSKNLRFLAARAGTARQSKTTSGAAGPSAQARSSEQHSEASKAKRERTGRTLGIVETRPRLKRVKKVQEFEKVPPGIPCGLRPQTAMSTITLEGVGGCLAETQKVELLRPAAPSPSDYDHFCKHCWGKGAVPGGDSEAGTGQGHRPRMHEAARRKQTLHRYWRGRVSQCGWTVRHATLNNWQVSLGMPENYGYLPVFFWYACLHRTPAKKFHCDCHRSMMTEGGSREIQKTEQQIEQPALTL